MQYSSSNHSIAIKRQLCKRTPFSVNLYSSASLHNERGGRKVITLLFIVKVPGFFSCKKTLAYFTYEKNLEKVRVIEHTEKTYYRYRVRRS